MVKFLYWSSVKPRRRLMGLSLPRIQSSSPRCCLSRSPSQLTDVTVQQKRYNQFHPTKASNWVSVTLSKLKKHWFTQHVLSLLQALNSQLKHIYSKAHFPLEPNKCSIFILLADTSILLPDVIHSIVKRWKTLWTININVLLECKFRLESFKLSLMIQLQGVVQLLTPLWFF